MTRPRPGVEGRHLRRHQTRGSRAGWAVGAASIVVVLTALALPPAALGALGLQVNPDSGMPGDPIAASATDFQPNQPVTFWWDATSLVGPPVTANSTGTAVLSFEIPAGAALGAHFLRACQGSGCPPASPTRFYVDARVTVVAPTPSSTATPRVSPSPAPTHGPTPGPTSTPLPTHEATPTAGPSATPARTPASTPVPTLPIPKLPVGAATPAPTPLPVAVVTPAPKPPDDEAAPEVPFPNLVALGIEVTQGMQNLDNEMPLVAARRTYARVYIHVEGAASWANVTGGLEARRNGQQLGWIWPENGWIVARAGGGDRTKVDDTLNFRLPASWLSGEVTLTTFVFSYFVESPFTKEPDGEDNDTTVMVEFKPGLPLTIHLAPLHLHRSYHPTDVERVYELNAGGELLAPGGNAGATYRITSGLFRYLPIAALNIDTFSGPIFPLHHHIGNEWNLGGACDATLLEWDGNHVVIDDWTLLIEDPEAVEAIEVGDSVVPDRDVLRSMDRRLDINYFYPQADGSASIWGTESGFGPSPPAGAPTWAYPCLIITDELHETNNALAVYGFFDDRSDERELFVGMMDSTLPAPFGGIATANTDSITMRMTDGFGGANPWLHSGAATIGHEAGHHAGLGHVPCKDDQPEDGTPDEIAGGALDDTHPMTLAFPDCRLAEPDPDGWFGFDVYADRFWSGGPTAMSNDPAAEAPSLVYPMMSYLGPGWPDPYHYCRLLTYYGVSCSPTELDLPWNPPNPKPDGSDPFAGVTPPPEGLEPGVDVAVVLVTESDDGSWSLEMLARNSSPTLDLRERIAAETALGLDEARPLLVVLGPNGETTWQASIPRAYLPHGSTGVAPSAMVVPLPPDASAIEVYGWDYTSKAKMEGSASVPTVAWLRKSTPDTAGVERGDEILVSFEFGDPAGDRLRFTLLYTPDGTHWQVVRDGTTEREVRVRVADLPSGDAPAFRIVAFDGWAVGEASLPVPELEAPRNPPRVLILAGGPATYPLGANVRLEASAFDLEDRALAGDAITWASSIDGPLGAGTELATRELSGGRHVITVTARDTDRLTGHATYVLTVDPTVVEARPDPELEAGLVAIFERLAAGQEPAPTPASGPDNHPDFLWAPIAVGAFLLALAAVLAVRRLRVGRPPEGRSQDVATLTDFEFDGEMATVIHGQKDQNVVVEHDGGPAAPAAGSRGAKDVVLTHQPDNLEMAADDLAMKDSKIKEN